MVFANHSAPCWHVAGAHFARAVLNMEKVANAILILTRKGYSYLRSDTQSCDVGLVSRQLNIG